MHLFSTKLGSYEEYCVCTGSMNEEGRADDPRSNKRLVPTTCIILILLWGPKAKSPKGETPKTKQKRDVFFPGIPGIVLELLASLAPFLVVATVEHSSNKRQK
jgi:hypothetical protein